MPVRTRAPLSTRRSQQSGSSPQRSIEMMVASSLHQRHWPKPKRVGVRLMLSARAPSVQLRSLSRRLRSMNSAYLNLRQPCQPLSRPNRLKQMQCVSEMNLVRQSMRGRRCWYQSVVTSKSAPLGSMNSRNFCAVGSPTSMAVLKPTAKLKRVQPAVANKLSAPLGRLLRCECSSKSDVFR